MGDADCTYDFRQLGLFIEKLREGYEFAMGSRWLGSIEDGAMPPLHRYFGTPLTTSILNRIYGSDFSDIHCGMRAMTRDALIRIGLTSQSWEYASEMVLKAVRLNLRTVEVPVTFYKDRDGRLSHHKRAGWFSPFQAAWINLRAMFIYRAEYFMLKPGLTIMLLGLLLTLPLSFGAIVIGPVTAQPYWMLLGLTLSILGLQSFFFGVLAQIFSDHSGRARRRWSGVFRYTRAMGVSALVFVSPWPHPSGKCRRGVLPDARGASPLPCELDRSFGGDGDSPHDHWFLGLLLHTPPAFDQVSIRCSDVAAEPQTSELMPDLPGHHYAPEV